MVNRFDEERVCVVLDPPQQPRVADGAEEFITARNSNALRLDSATQPRSIIVFDAIKFSARANVHPAATKVF